MEKCTFFLYNLGRTVQNEGKGIERQAIFMCTAITYHTKSFYFGRTLDYDISYGEQVVITPRNYPFHFQKAGDMTNHYGMIGMACVMEDYPLYFDAFNEKGLAMAGLNFVGNTVFQKEEAGKEAIAQYEFIPWILGQCASVAEARALLSRICLVDLSFRPELPAAQLHWLIADKKEAITVECVQEGLKIYDNPVGVLTNNPPFPIQLYGLNQYRGLSVKDPENTFAPQLSLEIVSRGMGGIGLPGDLSSPSRFARVAFTKLNSVLAETEESSVNQFFHILGSAEQQKGCCVLDNGGFEVTQYTSCGSVERGIYYYTTYENHRICAVDMHREDLTGNQLICFVLEKQEQILRQN